MFCIFWWCITRYDYIPIFQQTSEVAIERHGAKVWKAKLGKQILKNTVIDSQSLELKTNCQQSMIYLKILDKVVVYFSVSVYILWLLKKYMSTIQCNCCIQCRHDESWCLAAGILRIPEDPPVLKAKSFEYVLKFLGVAWQRMVEYSNWDKTSVPLRWNPLDHHMFLMMLERIALNWHKKARV